MAAATAARGTAHSPSVVTTCTALLAEARKVTIQLVSVNEHFICKICNGYFRDATKIKECAHTFCHSCIRVHFADKKRRTCPVCHVYLGVKPWTALVPDPAMQGLADKILPSFRDKEEAEAKELYARLGIKRKRSETAPKKSSTRLASTKAQAKARTSVTKIPYEMHPQRSPEIPMFLYMNHLKQVQMHSDPNTRMSRLRKYIAFKFGMEDPEEVEILCRDCPVGPEHSLEFVHRTIWRDNSTKMILEYRRKV
ncbi:hypothetical protein PINS_up006405 [Pythium insidiosum]|nr:hypothetical protein PINS_up006405 [Pythium insidiosum]